MALTVPLMRTVPMTRTVLRMTQGAGARLDGEKEVYKQRVPMRKQVARKAAKERKRVTTTEGVAEKGVAKASKKWSIREDMVEDSVAYESLAEAGGLEAGVVIT